MKALWLSRNRRHPQAGTRRGAPRLSLFPFLAVLICTMGALMLLLLFVSRQARLQAAGEAAAKDAEKRSSIAAEMEMVQWRVEQLKQSRKETETQLAEARLVLGHIEDHGRRLRDQFQELTRQARQAAGEGLKPGRFVAAGEEELRQIEGQIAQAQQQLAQAQQKSASRPKSYAIVPYDGPHQTRRRPIYVECRSDAVVLQPENVVFTEADFDEPLGPGNPLAAAIRAAREQMLLQGRADPQNAGEPYPLLLVRPDGIAAYDAALAAMKSWGSEFGYELINADWQLKYPPPDPNVARSIAQAVFLARQEHARLIAAAPSKYGKRPRSGSYRSPTGDAVAQQGRAGEGESPGFYASKPAERYAHAAGGDGSSTAGHRGGPSGGPGGSSQGEGGSGNGSGQGSGHGAGGVGGVGSGGPSSDAEFAANNPYAALPAPGMVGPSGMGPGGMGMGAGPGNGMGNGSGYGPGNGAGGAPGFAVAAGAGGPATMNPGMGAGPGNGMGNGSGYGPGNGAGGAPGYAVASGVGGPATMNPGGMGTGAGPGNGMGNGSRYVPSDGMGGVPGANLAGGPTSDLRPLTSAPVGGPATMNPGGMGNSPTMAGGLAGPPTMNPAGTGNNCAISGTQSASQFAGQPGEPHPEGSGSASGSAAVVRPDGYIAGRPNDGNPAPAARRPDPSSAAAMGPAVAMRPGEWRPSEETTPPKRDREQEEKEAKEKKKHPYDKVKIDHDQDDWALRNAARHAAAISRPVRVDCYPDRIVLPPEANGDEPHVILCENNGQRDADKLVAAVWEIMDTWGMAGREMYWRPVLNVYVFSGAEARMLDLTRCLEGSGLVIQRKQ